MRCKCRLCGESFHATKEQIELVEIGEIQKPDTCTECLGEQHQELENYSDADPGL